MFADAMTIALDSYKDANRRKGVVYFLLAIAIMQVSVFALYDEISLGIEIKLIKDAGLAMVTLVGVLSGLTIAFQIPRELREKTAMTLFAKPLGRESYLVGKLIGISGLVLRNMLVVCVGVLIIFVIVAGADMRGILGDKFIAAYFQSFLLSFVGVIDLIALTIVLSLYLTEGIVVISSLVMFFVGNCMYMLSASGGSMSAVAGFLKYVFPNFYLFDIKNEAAVSYDLPTSVSYMLITSGYGLVYAAAVIALAVILFKKRDL